MSKHQVGYIIFAALSVVYLIFFKWFDWPIEGFFGLLIVWFLLVVYGSFIIQANYHLNAVCKVKTNKNIVAITFDDGPTEFTPLALEVLKKYNQKATFFCIGKQIEQFPEITKEILAEQHEVGNHTYSHDKAMDFKNTKFIIQEILSNKELIEKTINLPTNLFRPPFGVTNPNIRRAVKKTNQKVIGWNIRSLDTVKDNEDEIFQRIVKKISPGSIILLHDTSKKSVNVLERLLIHLQENNYKSVTISNLINESL